MRQELTALPGRPQDLVIVQLDCAKQALMKANTIQQCQDLQETIARAEAFKTYGKQHRLGKEAIAYAHAIKTEALRKLGVLLEATHRNAGRRLNGRGLGGSVKELPKDTRATLADLGIDKKVSWIARQLAALPQELFEQVRAGTLSLTNAVEGARRAQTDPIPWSIESVEQDLRKAFNAAIQGAPPQERDNVRALARRLVDELDEAANPELRDAVDIARDGLSVRDAEPGGRRYFDSDGQCIGGCKSTYSDEYKTLTTKQEGVTPLRRKQVEARLDDIEQGILPTKRTAQTHFAVLWAIKDLPRTPSQGLKQ